MKKILLMLALAVSLTIAPTQKSHAFVWVVVKAAIKKVIKALDLQVQRLQNKTIWLQNAQKAVENSMSKLRLDEISDWVEKQRALYKDYFEELQKVKSLITYYRRIKSITEKQVHLIGSYKRSYALYKQDPHFAAAEIAYMGKVYTGIIEESIKNLDQVFMVLRSFSLQMTDAKRLEIINDAADKIDQNNNDLQQFNTQNALLSMHRAKDLREVEALKSLYGIK